MIKSVINGRDPEVLKTILGYYARPTGPILDVTCNTRRMWTGVDKEGVIFLDINKSQKR